MYLYWIVIVGLTAFAAFAVGVLWASYAQKEALAGQWEDLRREKADLLHEMVAFELVKREAREAPTRDDEVMALFEQQRATGFASEATRHRPGTIVKVDGVQPGESIWDAAERERREKADSSAKSGNPDAEDRAGSTGQGQDDRQDEVITTYCGPCGAPHPRNRIGEDNQCNWYRVVGKPMLPPRPNPAPVNIEHASPLEACEAVIRERQAAQLAEQMEMEDAQMRHEAAKVAFDPMPWCPDCRAFHPENQTGMLEECATYTPPHLPSLQIDSTPIGDGRVERTRCPDRCAHVVGGVRVARLGHNGVWGAKLDVKCVDCGQRYVGGFPMDPDELERKVMGEDAPMPLDTGGSWPAGVREFVDEVKRADSPMDRAMARFEEMGMPPDDAPTVEYRSMEEAEAVHGPVVETFEAMSREADQADALAFALSERRRLDPEAPGYIITGIDRAALQAELRGACRHCGAVTTHATGCPDEGRTSRC